jgi:hypothetical protein
MIFTKASATAAHHCAPFISQPVLTGSLFKPFEESHEEAFGGTSPATTFAAMQGEEPLTSPSPDTEQVLQAVAQVPRGILPGPYWQRIGMWRGQR